MVLDIKIRTIHNLTFQFGPPCEVEFSYYGDNTTVRWERQMRERWDERDRLSHLGVMTDERLLYTVYWTWQALLICKDVSVWREAGGAEWATKGEVMNLSISSHLVGNQNQCLERGIYMAKIALSFTWQWDVLINSSSLAPQKLLQIFYTVLF